MFRAVRTPTDRIRRQNYLAFFILMITEIPSEAKDVESLGESFQVSGGEDTDR